jgi:hypothetical protein
MADLDDKLGQEFVCARCGEKGAHVERVSMSGTGVRFDINSIRWYNDSR